jgi:hypothetical protein
LSEVGLPESLRCTTCRSSAAKVGLASQGAFHEALVLISVKTASGFYAIFVVVRLVPS